MHKKISQQKCKINTEKNSEIRKEQRDQKQNLIQKKKKTRPE